MVQSDSRTTTSIKYSFPFFSILAVKRKAPFTP